MKRFNVLYKGQRVFENLTYDQTADALHELALKFYENEKINPNDIQMEEID
jgi:hypothetical protein